LEPLWGLWELPSWFEYMQRVAFTRMMGCRLEADSDRQTVGEHGWVAGEAVAIQAGLLTGDTARILLTERHSERWSSDKRHNLPSRIYVKKLLLLVLWIAPFS
jgi:hypothetical protein